MKTVSKFMVFAAAAVLGLATSCNCGDNVSGTITGTGSDLMEVRAYIPVEGTMVFQDTVAITDDRFSVNIPDSTAVVVYLLPVPGENAQNRVMLNIQETMVLLPGDKIKVSGSVDSPVLKSKKLYNPLAAFPERTEILGRLSELYDGFENLNPNDRDAYTALMEKAEALGAQKDSLYAKYVSENPDGDISAYLAVQIEDSHLAVDALEGLSEANKNGAMKDIVAKYTENHKSQIRKEQNKENILPGKPAPDFSLPDLNGEIKTLASFKGKYVLLDFWGTWCYWCMKGMPDMKTYYAKYSKKIEFVGINCGDTEEKWRAGVEKEGLNWTNLFNGNANEIVENYAIEGYPTKVLIDPKGNIVEVFIGESEDLYNKLDELF